MGVLIPCLLYMHMLESIHLPPIDKNESHVSPSERSACAALRGCSGMKYPLFL